MRDFQRSVLRVLGAVLLVAGSIVLGGLVVGSPAEAAPTSEGPFFSSEVYTTSTTCSNTSALRAAADLLDDEWYAVAQADSYVAGVIPGPMDPTPNPTPITLGGVTANVSKHDVDDVTALSTAPMSWGSVDGIASTNDPETATGATLQDCSPRPASLYVRLQHRLRLRLRLLLRLKPRRRPKFPLLPIRPPRLRR